jgi:hypothetical protein
MEQTTDIHKTSGSWRYQHIAWLLIWMAVAVQVARIMGVTAVHGELPFLSANDRSRWSAIAALTEDGKWDIDRIEALLDSKGKSKIWSSIDIVRHRGADGKEHFYSSKPPLLTAMYALVTKPVTMITGKKLTEEPFLIGRAVMVIVNVLPLLLWWIWLYRWLESNVENEWARLVLLNTGLWGTFLTTFSVTLSNHLHAAIFFTISMTLVWELARRDNLGETQGWWRWIVCGLSAGMTVACELPALCWAVVAAVILLFVDWRKCVLGYGVAAAAIAAAFLATNYSAHMDFRPPYSHRGVGSLIGSIPKEADSVQPALASIVELANKNGYALSDQTKAIPARLADLTQIIDESAGQRVAVRADSESKNWNVYHWDDWYDFPKSYWLPGNKKGVDLGEPNRWLYTLHFLIGHHGIYSVTPFWLLTFAGAWYWFLGAKEDEARPVGLKAFALSNRGFATAVILMSLACFVFYASRTQEDRNYGGVSSGFRWLFWLISAWIWLCVPAVERAASSKVWRWIVAALLVMSIFSATIPWPNPWTHPWPYRITTWLYPT